jgi:CubicO group peptidase (beta-lactamase class C family)
MLSLFRHRLPSCALAVLLATVVAVSGVQAEIDLPAGRAEKVGMSTQRLNRINEVMARHIEAGNITGAVTAVARRGKIVHFEAHGYSDLEKKTPMTKDALFRMASSSKPVTGVAVLMLVEEGRIRLSDPVSQYIPEFKNMKVAVPKEGQVEPTTAPAPNGPKPEVDLVPATREITIKDLMTHTSGLLSGGLGTAVSDVQRQPDDTLASYTRWPVTSRSSALCRWTSSRARAGVTAPVPASIRWDASLK